MIVFPYPAENLNLAIFIHVFSISSLALCPSPISAWRSKSVSSLPSPSVSFSLSLIQSVLDSKFVYIPLSVRLHLDGNIPNELSYLLLKQRERPSCGHTWFMSTGHTRPHSPILCLSHTQTKCVLNIACGTHTHADRTTSDCLWTSG